MKSQFNVPFRSSSGVRPAVPPALAAAYRAAIVLSALACGAAATAHAAASASACGVKPACRTRTSGSARSATGTGSASAWMGGVIYGFDEKTSVTFRVSGGDGAFIAPASSVTKYTVAPAYKVSSNFTVRAEVSKIKQAGPDATFFGLQGVYKF